MEGAGGYKILEQNFSVGLHRQDSISRPDLVQHPVAEAEQLLIANGAGHTEGIDLAVGLEASEGVAIDRRLRVRSDAKVDLAVWGNGDCLEYQRLIGGKRGVLRPGWLHLAINRVTVGVRSINEKVAIGQTLESLSRETVGQEPAWVGTRERKVRIERPVAQQSRNVV